MAYEQYKNVLTDDVITTSIVDGCIRRIISLEGYERIEILDKSISDAWTVRLKTEEYISFLEGLDDFEFKKVCLDKKNLTKEELETSLLAAESRSNHPIAKAICLHRNVSKIALAQKNYEEIPGLGVKTEYDGDIILAGNVDLLQKLGENLYYFGTDEQNFKINGKMPVSQWYNEEINYSYNSGKSKNGKSIKSKNNPELNDLKICTYFPVHRPGIKRQ